MTACCIPQPALQTRFLLPGVPKIGFYMGGDRCPEDFSFPSCLRACLDTFGEDLGCKWICTHDTTWRLDNTYTFLVGVTGRAFQLSWKPGWPAWDGAADFRFDGQAAYCGLEIVDPHGQRDEDLYRAAILHSLLEKNCPVIAFGVIGPPEACLITGFDDGGDVLMGWSYFQDFPEFNQGVEFEPTGEFRKRDWFAATRGLLVFSDSRRSLSPAGQCREALRHAVEWIRAPRAPDGPVADCSGLAAYAAWAADLQNDAAFPPGDLETLRLCFMAHDDAVGAVAEGRWYGAKFMELLADAAPGMEEDLLAAAGCFEAEHDLMWKIWGLVGGNIRSDETVRRLADPAVRRAIVPLILQARGQDAQAAAYIEHALKTSQA